MSAKPKKKPSSTLVVYGELGLCKRNHRPLKKKTPPPKGKGFKGYNYIAEGDYLTPTSEAFYELHKSIFPNPGIPFQQELVSLINQIRPDNPEANNFWNDENNRAELYAALMNDTEVREYAEVGDDHVIHVTPQKAIDLILKRAETMYRQHKESLSPFRRGSNLKDANEKIEILQRQKTEKNLRVVCEQYFPGNYSPAESVEHSIRKMASKLHLSIEDDKDIDELIKHCEEAVQTTTLSKNVKSYYNRNPQRRPAR